MRLFIALNFNELKDYFKELQKQVPKENNKLTFSDDFHLTLKFLGDVEENKVDGLKQKLKAIKFKEFETEIKEIGFFTEQFPKVIWVMSDAKEIYELQKQIEEKLDEFRKDDFDFKAHITLARVKWCNDRNDFVEKVKKIKTETKKVKISKFELVKSVLTGDGPVYEVIARF